MKVVINKFPTKFYRSQGRRLSNWNVNCGNSNAEGLFIFGLLTRKKIPNFKETGKRKKKSSSI